MPWTLRVAAAVAAISGFSRPAPPLQCGRRVVSSRPPIVYPAPPPGASGGPRPGVSMGWDTASADADRAERGARRRPPELVHAQDVRELVDLVLREVLLVVVFEDVNALRRNQVVVHR